MNADSLQDLSLLGGFSLLTTPLRVYERVRYTRRVEETEIEKAPIFIIGHWRGGTTHLHNLLCQDQRFGYVTTLQTIALSPLVLSQIRAPVLRTIRSVQKRPA